MDNMLPGDTAAEPFGKNGIRRKGYSEIVIEGTRRRAMVFVGGSIVRKTDRVLSKGDDVVVCFP